MRGLINGADTDAIYLDHGRIFRGFGGSNTPQGRVNTPQKMLNPPPPPKKLETPQKFH